MKYKFVCIQCVYIIMHTNIPQENTWNENNFTNFLSIVESLQMHHKNHLYPEDWKQRIVGQCSTSYCLCSLASSLRLTSALCSYRPSFDQCSSYHPLFIVWSCTRLTFSVINPSLTVDWILKKKILHPLFFIWSCTNFTFSIIKSSLTVDWIWKKKKKLKLKCN